MYACMLGIKRLARWLDIRLEPRALLLCVITALVINFTAISISSFLTTSHYLLLTVLVIAGAVLVTKYNDRLVKAHAMSTGTLLARIHSEPEFHEVSEPVISQTFEPALQTAAAESALAPEPEPLPSFTLNIESTPELESEPVAITDISCTVPVSEPEADTSLIDEISSRFEAELEARHDAVLASFSTAVADPFVGTVEVQQPDDYVAEEYIEEQPVPVDTTLQLQPETNEILEPEIEPITAEVKETEVEPVSEEIEEIKEPEAEPITVPAEEIKEPPFDFVTVNAFKSLDEFLNYADEQKNLHHDQNAIYTYEQALIRYSDDDYAPFIVIDMANICKAAGQYRKAIAIYQLAFTLRTVRGSKTIRDDFHKTLAYLEAVEYILSQHGAPNLPFIEIPADYLEEIETEFSQRQKEKLVS